MRVLLTLALIASWAVPAAAGVPTNAQWRVIGSCPGGSDPGALYDSRRDRVLVFDGAARTLWASPLHGPTVWTQIVAAGEAPEPVYGASEHFTLAYDETRDRVIVCRSARGEVYELTLGATPRWNRIVESSGGGGTDASVIYDPVRNRLVAFGGCGTFGAFNQLWTVSLDGGGEWLELRTTGDIPGGRCNASAIYDPVGDRLIIFGGFPAATARCRVARSRCAADAAGAGQRSVQ